MMSERTASVSRNRSSRSAFTLVELLVVIAIIGILIALLLPAVQAAREAARRSQCINSLKQIGLSMHNYHDIHKCFPPGSIYYDPGNTAEWGWMAFLLPFIEEKPLYDAVQLDTLRLNEVVALGANPGTIAELLGTPISTIVCPSAGAQPTSGRRYGDLNGDGPTNADDNVGTSSYVGCAGWRRMDGTAANRGPRVNYGIFYANRANMFQDITDGTSNTFAAGERVGNGSVWPGPRELNIVLDTTTGASDDGIDQRRGIWEVVGVVAPNPNSNNIYGFRSYHPDGSNFSLCDGSARFVSELIESTQPPPAIRNGSAAFNWGSAGAASIISNPRTECVGWGVYQLLGMREDQQPIDKDF